MKRPTELVLGGHWLLLLEFCFPTGGARGLGETLHGAVLNWGIGKMVNAACFSYPSNAVCLVSMMQGAGFSLAPMF